LLEQLGVTSEKIPFSIGRSGLSGARERRASRGVVGHGREPGTLGLGEKVGP
jgi:hypothetical protein